MGASRRRRGGKRAAHGLGFCRRTGLFSIREGVKCPLNARAGSVHVCLVIDSCARVRDFSVVSQRKRRRRSRFGGFILLAAAVSSDGAAFPVRFSSHLTTESFFYLYCCDWSLRVSCWKLRLAFMLATNRNLQLSDCGSNLPFLLSFHISTAK